MDDGGQSCQNLSEADGQQHNTHTALHRVIDDWLCIMSDGNHLTAVCSFNITKCFDTINHFIGLLCKTYFRNMLAPSHKVNCLQPEKKTC